MQVRVVLREFFEDVSVFGGLTFYLIVLILGYLVNQQRFVAVLAVGLLALYVVVAILRLLFFRVRPIKKKYDSLLEKIDAGSFPSMHAARATYLLLMIAEVLGKREIFIFVLVLIFLVAYSRFYLKMHYLSDCVAGVILGVLFSYFLH